MIMEPLRALRATPSISTLTSSSLIGSRGAVRCRLHDAAAVFDVVLELVPEVFHEALHRPGGGIAQRADRVSLDLVGDVDQHVDVGLAALTCQDPLDGAVEPAGPFAARRALPAGL